MKLQLVETPDYILALSDKQPVEGYYFDTNINKVRNTNSAEYAIDNSVRQIIGYKPKGNAPELNGLPLLPQIVVEDDLKNHCIDFLRYFQTTAELEFHSTGENHGLPHNEVFNKYIQSLKQPKWFVAEMDCGEVRQCMCENNSNCLKPVFKTQHTTKNGTTYLVGTYEY